jgi:hypothetical protein
VGAWAAALLLISCGRCGGPELVPLIEFGPTKRVATSGSEIFGINEAVSIPEAWIERGWIQPDEEPTELIADAQLSAALGAGIVRGNSPVYPYLSHYGLRAQGGDWTRSDHWVRAVQDAGLDAVLVLGPWPGNRTGAYTSSYIPSDLEAYDAYLRAVVERYDGDGDSDMPGLKRPIRYWEIDNEPDLHNSAPARGTPNPPEPSQFQTPAEYAQILIRSARVIRETDPDATVLSAGLFRPHHSSGRDYLEAVLAIPGARESIDILSLHCYFDQDSLETLNRTMLHATQLLPDVPIWITETGVPSIGRSPHIDTVWQSQMVVAIYGGFLAAGADRVFWHTLADPPNAERHMKRAPFASHSLLQSTEGASPGPGQSRNDKPAGTVYRRLAQLMASVDPSSIQEILVPGGRMIETDSGWLAFWGEPQVPQGGEEAVSLMTGGTIDASESVVAPAWIYKASP